MSTSTIVGIVIVILLALGGWYFFSTNPSPLAPSTGSNMPVLPADGTGQTPEMEVVDDALKSAVAYGTDGFSPKTVTIKKGGTVTWTNQGGAAGMWIASAVHPTHSVYSGTTLAEHCNGTSATSFDQCKDASVYSFTFSKIGTWNYHNHLNPNDFGTVIVVE